MARDDVFLPFNENEYRAVVNPTRLTILAVAYGRRFTFVPGELHNPRRAPVQMMKTRMARKAVKSQRRFLELMTVEQGFRLMKLARELENFPEAFRRVTGRTGKKAGEMLMERQERQSLRRVLIHQIGIPDDLLANWTVADMRAVIKDETLAGDLDDATGRPRLDRLMNPNDGGNIFDIADRVNRQSVQELSGPSMDDFVPMDGDGSPAPLDGDRRVPETGLPGDFVDIMAMDDEQLAELERVSDAEALAVNQPTPEEVAARATAEYDAKHGGEVRGQTDGSKHAEAQKQTFKGLQSGEAQEVDSKDLSEPIEITPPERPQVSARDRVLELRKQIEDLGGNWHPRSGAERLERDLDSLIAEAVNTEAAKASE